MCPRRERERDEDDDDDDGTNHKNKKQKTNNFNKGNAKGGKGNIKKGKSGKKNNSGNNSGMVTTKLSRHPAGRGYRVLKPKYIPTKIHYTRAFKRELEASLTLQDILRLEEEARVQKEIRRQEGLAVKEHNRTVRLHRKMVIQEHAERRARDAEYARQKMLRSN